MNQTTDWGRYLALMEQLLALELDDPRRAELVIQLERIAALAAPLTFVADSLGDQGYLTGSQFTVADAYLFAVLNWVGFAKFSLDAWPALQAYQARVAELPVVREALRREGLQ